jgi:hypothetical protein
MGSRHPRLMMLTCTSLVQGFCVTSQSSSSWGCPVSRLGRHHFHPRDRTGFGPVCETGRRVSDGFSKRSPYFALIAAMVHAFRMVDA